MQTLFIISVLCFVGILCAALALARHIKRQVVSAAPLNQPDFKHHLLSIVPPNDVASQTLRSQFLRVDTMQTVLQDSPVRTQQVRLDEAPITPLAEPASVAASIRPAPVDVVLLQASTAEIAAQTPAAIPQIAQEISAEVQAPQPASTEGDARPMPEPTLVTSQPADGLVRTKPRLNPIPFRPRLNSLNQSVHDITANKHWVLPAHPVSIMRLPLRRVGRSRQASETAGVLIADRRPPQPANHAGGIRRLDPAYFNKDMGDLTDPYQPPRLRVNDRKR